MSEDKKIWIERELNKCEDGLNRPLKAIEKNSLQVYYESLKQELECLK